MVFVDTNTLLAKKTKEKGENMRLLSIFNKKKHLQNNNLEQKLRELREQDIQRYEANLPRVDEKSKAINERDTDFKDLP